MKELETLLGTLLKMGWKPWGLKSYSEALVSGVVVTFYTNEGTRFHTSLREVVSLEGELWQFVVENKLYKKTNTVYEKHFGIGEYKNFYDAFYEYRLIESAITPEEALSQFLIDNIKIDG